MSQIIESSLPMVIQKQEQETAINYRVFGNSNGVGIKTINLVNFQDLLYAPQGTIGSSTMPNVLTLTLEPNTNYTLYSDGTGSTTGDAETNRSIYFNNSTSASAVYQGYSVTSTSDSNGKIQIGFWSTRANAQQYINGAAHIWLIEGDTETPYVPSGYKIPLTLTSGVMDNLVPEISTANGWRPGYINNNGSYNPNNTNGEWLSPYIDINVTTVLPITIKYKPVSSSASLSLYFFDANGDYISKKTSTANGNVVFNSEIPTNATKMCYAFRTYCITEQDLIQAEMWTSFYAPYRYEQNYDLFIGDTKLGAEEYVDYQEQKVWKRTEQLFNKDDFILAALSLYKETKITSSTTACIIVMPCEANTQYVISIPNYDSTVWRIGLSDYEIPASNQEYTRIESEKPSGNVSTFTTLATTKNILLQIQKATVDITKNSIMLISGSTAPETYISYLQPIDPPAPLPSITSYIGENTFNSTEVINKMRIEFNEGFIYEGKDVSQFHINNQFYDLVDSSFYSLIADDFNSLTSYSEGDFCIHDYQLYKCLFATQGDWISECWELISLAELIQGDGQEVGVDDDTWRIIYEICKGTLSGDFVVDYDYIERGKFTYCDMSTIELPNCSRINPYLLYGCKNLSFVSAPNCTSIGTAGLSACDALISYNMPLVSIIGTEAFRGCVSLPLASFSQNLQISSRAFLGCTSLSEVNMPAVSIIYSDAFSGCTALTTLELPGCISIYSYALRNCTKLETASFPNLVRIYSSGFANCAKLMSLYLLSTKMCTLQNANAFGGTPISVSTGGIYGSIYVPSTLVDSYKVATQWVTYADRFVAYQE